MGFRNLSPTKGFGVIEILVIVVVLALVGGGVYLYFQQAQSDDSKSNLNSKEQAELKAACKIEINDELLCAVFTRFGQDSDGPVTITTKMTSENATTNSVMKMDGKNSHTISEMDGQKYESMLINDVLYTKMDGVWYKQTVSSEAEASADVPDAAEPDQITNDVLDKDKADQVDYKRLGTEKCGEITCVKFQVSTKQDPDSVSYLWIDPDTSRLMRMQSEADGNTFDLVYEYGPVTITPPADAKDYSEMFSM